jgi:hypothetical protein
MALLDVAVHGVMAAASVMVIAMLEPEPGVPPPTEMEGQTAAGDTGFRHSTNWLE